MNEMVKAANRLKIEQVIKNLKKRDMKGYYCETTDAALERILTIIAKWEKETGRAPRIGWGGSETLNEIGIKVVLEALRYDTIDPYTNVTPEESIQKRREALTSDVFLTSTNAITLEGELMNIDGTGNRVAAMCFGPDKVIVVVGANKIVRNQEQGINRIKNCACTGNAIRLRKETPCGLTGKCTDCLMTGQTICAYTVITRFSMVKDRIEVVFINEDFGF